MALPTANPFQTPWEDNNQPDGRGSVVAVTAAAAAGDQYIDCRKSGAFSLTFPAGNFNTVQMINARPGQVVDLYLKQDGTGSRSVTTWTDVLWAGGTAVTLTATAAATDWLRFTWNDTLKKWLGETVAKAVA